MESANEQQDCYPRCLSGHQLALEAQSRLRDSFDDIGGLDAIKSEFKDNSVRIVVWGPQDVKAIKAILDEMMEDEFSCDAENDLKIEEHKNLVIYTLNIQDYVLDWFVNKKW